MRSVTRIEPIELSVTRMPSGLSGNGRMAMRVNTFFLGHPSSTCAPVLITLPKEDPAAAAEPGRAFSVAIRNCGRGFQCGTLVPADLRLTLQIAQSAL